MPLDLSKKDLTKLPPLPEKVGDFYCYENNLTDLVGAPKFINGFFVYSHNKLTSLFGLPNKIETLFNCMSNPNLLDISDIWMSDIGKITLRITTKMAILPLIKFHEISGYMDTVIFEIHERNCGNSKRNIINFQYDLIENGYEENARWKPHWI